MSINRLIVFPVSFSLVKNNNNKAPIFMTESQVSNKIIQNFDTLMLCMSISNELQLCIAIAEQYSCKTIAICLHETY